MGPYVPPPVAYGMSYSSGFCWRSYQRRLGPLATISRLLARRRDNGNPPAKESTRLCPWGLWVGSVRSPVRSCGLVPSLAVMELGQARMHREFRQECSETR